MRTKIGRGSCVDRIRSLPYNLQEEILSKLSIGDAARTSVLSWRWRYLWLSLPDLIFEDTFISSVKVNPEDLNRVATDTITKILLQHDGPIREFCLSNKKLEINSVDIDTWIKHLWSQNLEHLILEIWVGQRYRLHSRLFSFFNLRTLELSHCVVQLPSRFTGFKSLTTMYLSNVTIATDAFERLTKKCSVLTDLRLLNVDGLECVNISAPKIKIFNFTGAFKKICFKICMAEWISVRYTELPERTPEYVIKGPSLSTRMHLVTGECFMKVLRVQDRSSMHLMLDFPLKNLEYVYLFGMAFEEISEVSFLLWLITILPKLSYLVITIYSATLTYTPTEAEHATKLIKEENNKLGSLELRKVTITDIIGASAEMEFIRVLLAKSPLLETMTLKVYKDEKIDDKGILKKLLSFPRSSTTAKVIFSD